MRLLAGIALLAPLVVNAQQICLPYEQVTKTLRTKHKEQIMFRGYGPKPTSTLIEIWGRRGEGTWTVVQRQIITVGGKKTECATIQGNGAEWSWIVDKAFALPPSF